MFSEVWERQGPERAKEFLRRITGVLLAVLAAFTVAGILVAEPIVRIYSHDWKNHPEDLKFAVLLLQIMFPYLFFAGGAALASAALNARGRFLVSALAPVLLNLMFLAGAAAAFPFESMRTRAILFTIGGLAGGLVSWICQFPEMKRIGLPIGMSWAHATPTSNALRRSCCPDFWRSGSRK